MIVAFTAEERKAEQRKTGLHLPSWFNVLHYFAARSLKFQLKIMIKPETEPTTVKNVHPNCPVSVCL